MNIDGRTKKAIHEALIEAYPTANALAQFTSYGLDVQLPTVTFFGSDLNTIVFELIRWVISRGRLAELVLGAAADNPGARKLVAVAGQFRLAADAPGEVERIVLKDIPFENVAQWLDRMARLRRAVCRIEPQPPPDTNGYATGFLVAPDVVMTNSHVVGPFVAAGAGRVVVRFDYETGADGVAVGAGRVCRLAPVWRIADSPVEELDYALIRLADRAGDDEAGGGRRGVLTPSRRVPAAGNPLLIVQHPKAAPLKLSIGSVVDPGCGPTRVSYTANTEPGSSGSPCLTSGLDLVALHHYGASPNRGVRLGPILDDLAARGLDDVCVAVG